MAGDEHAGCRSSTAGVGTAGHERPGDNARNTPDGSGEQQYEAGDADPDAHLDALAGRGHVLGTDLYLSFTRESSLLLEGLTAGSRTLSDQTSRLTTLCVRCSVLFLATHPQSPHQTLSNPTFWIELLAFFRGQYAQESEADAAWETFLRSQKGSMSPSEVAMARDESGVHGMGGM
jgi:hypothetical protein